jgi:uncharacterized membrane protein HdeD (DUF308 family)
MAQTETRIVAFTILSERWWLLALRGIAAIIFGALAILMPGITIVVLTIWFAAFMAVDGILALIAGISALAHHRHSAALIAEGVFGLAIAALLMVWPGAGFAAIVLLIAAWALATGAALLWAAIMLPLPAGRLLIGVSALLSIILGLLLFMHPLAGAVVLALWLGIYALMAGILMLASALSLRRTRALPPVPPAKLAA